VFLLARFIDVWNAAFDDTVGLLDDLLEEVPRATASARLPCVAAVFHPKTATLQHLDAAKRPFVLKELKRLYYVEYVRQQAARVQPALGIPQAQPQPAQIHQPLANPPAARRAPGAARNFNPANVDVRAFAEEAFANRVGQARAQVAEAVGAPLDQPVDIFSEYTKFIATIIRVDYAEMDWSQFWNEDRRKSFPTVWTIARRVLAITATSAPVESLFSIAGIVDDDLRARLSARALELLTLIKANLRVIVDNQWLQSWVRSGDPANHVNQPPPAPPPAAPAAIPAAPQDGLNPEAEAGNNVEDEEEEEPPQEEVAFNEFVDAMEFEFL